MIKYLVSVLVCLVLAFFSVEISPLDKMNAQGTSFNAKAFASDFLKNQIPTAFGAAVEINELKRQIQSNKTQAFQDHSHAVSIGNIRNFLVQGSGTLKSIESSSLLLDCQGQSLTIETEYIYGNAIRDASGLFDITPFTSTEDINNIAAEINRIVRKEVVPPLLKELKIGQQIEFIGALELNQEHVKLEQLSVYPIQVKIKPE